MKVLLVNDNHPPEVWGGAETSVHQLARGLAREGCDVHVLARATGEVSPLTDGYRFHAASARAPSTLAGVLLKDRYVHPARMHRGIRRVVRANGPFDVVHANNAISGLALLGRQLPRRTVRVLTARSYSQVCPMGNGLCLGDAAQITCETARECAAHTHPTSPAKSALVGMALGASHPRIRRTLMRADVLIADSDYVRRVLQAETARTDIAVIHEAVDVQGKEPDGGSRDPFVLFVGRLTPEKGVMTLVEAFERALPSLPSDAKLVLAGEGGARPAIEKRASSPALAGRIELLGRRPNSELADLFRRTALLSVPSLWQEPFGIVAAEGALFGAPVVVSRAGGLPEALGGAPPEGSLIPPGDPVALADVIVRALRDRSIRAPDREAVRARVDHIEVARRHVKLYEATLRR